MKGILGATFVPCQAWTTTFFDTKVVGRANALVGGWGNAGGGFTFIIMLAMYNRLRNDGLEAHKAWRASFAIIPLPILLFVALIILLFGTDHPHGRWAERHKPPQEHTISESHSCDPVGQVPSVDETGEVGRAEKKTVEVSVRSTAAQSIDSEFERFSELFPHSLLASLRDELFLIAAAPIPVQKESQNLSWKILREVCFNPLTWLPALAYMSPSLFLVNIVYLALIDRTCSNIWLRARY